MVNELKWAADSKWDEFIKWINKNTNAINREKGIGNYIIGACISWVVGKICDTVWDAIKKQYVEICREEKICKEEYTTSHNSSSDESVGGLPPGLTPNQQYEVEHNLQRNQKDNYRLKYRPSRL
ncbi:MAG: hypothetical protein ACP5IO_05515 [Elusimicrobiales bacterium]